MLVLQIQMNRDHPGFNYRKHNSICLLRDSAFVAWQTNQCRGWSKLRKGRSRPSCASACFLEVSASSDQANKITDAGHDVEEPPNGGGHTLTNGRLFRDFETAA